MRVVEVRRPGSNLGRVQKGQASVSKRIREVVVLEQVAKAKRLQVDAERRLERLVAEARSKGSTWQEIGDALGVTLQGARQKFGSIERRASARRVSQGSGSVV